MTQVRVLLITLFIDYNTFSTGDTPVSIVEYDSERLLVLVENTGGRRVDLIRKDGTTSAAFLINSTALTGVVRSLVKLSDTSLLISKSSAIEKFAPSKSRVTQGANPYVNAPAGSCATSTTLISSMAVLSSSKILYAHAAATPNNKIGLIAATGYSVAGDCLTSVAAPTTLALPTSVLMHSTGKLLVAYGSTTSGSNFIYSYDVNDSTNTINGPISAFNDFAIVNGPSSMTEDTVTGNVYVANGNSAYNTIEKFSYDSTTKLLSRLSVQPFVSPQIYTRCVSDMKILSQ